MLHPWKKVHSFSLSLFLSVSIHVDKWSRGRNRLKDRRATISSRSARYGYRIHNSLSLARVGTRTGVYPVRRIRRSGIKVSVGGLLVSTLEEEQEQEEKEKNVDGRYEVIGALERLDAF